jgi:Transposase DDE domain group 1
LYEEFYCARGDMENRIKEQMMLFADRTSTSWLRSNQIRLYFSTVAYLLMQALRRLGLAGTELAKAQCNTVRLKLLKIGAQIRITVRKVWVSLSTAILTWSYSARCTDSCKLQLCAAEGRKSRDQLCCTMSRREWCVFP